eukprot:gnl/MRDRNA2_/MRDRNA2_61738_c0_seq2.p1 gnl/MRDRNA2_/MRDRNA2_61738_c0~~gnl/MRDRNA2_/MRDRNA2_61738_c0_seq2.p1  ORF type:complete len:492 (+),score=96.02 gnl/MRDRNA2_/MRDRNA2_61738_c0_seq2:111-1586(+)
MEFSINETMGSITTDDQLIVNNDKVACNAYFCADTSNAMESENNIEYHERARREPKQHERAEKPSYEEVSKHCKVLTESLDILEQRYTEMKNSHDHLRHTNVLLVERLLAAQVKSRAEEAKATWLVEEAKEKQRMEKEQEQESRGRDAASKKNSRSPSIRVRIVEDRDKREAERHEQREPDSRLPELNPSSYEPERERSSSPSVLSTKSSVKASTQNADQCGIGFTEIAKLRSEVGAWWSDLRSQEVASGKEIPGIRNEVAAQADQLRRIVSLLRRGLKSAVSDYKAPSAVSSQTIEREASVGGSSFQSFFENAWSSSVSQSFNTKVASASPSPAAMYIPGSGLVSTSASISHPSQSQGEPETVTRCWAPAQFVRDGTRSAQKCYDGELDVELPMQPNQAPAVSFVRGRPRSPGLPYVGSCLRSPSPVSTVQVTRSRSVSPVSSVCLLQRTAPLASTCMGTPITSALPRAQGVPARSSLAAQARKIVTVLR